ncbi:hypothetical protein [Ohessyouella blattaphilus]|uniref:DNA phosphorothioation-associated protein 4 n=1 Tax=Ohessyouella blattaphilus TaxID=2949333 RepID=A0ABT1EJL8_9FIRM|nr:hypothetical protein [Ohessyouella blattaphilus]MCP1110888.1 hypothetical protein [Ohessyouella blattaphilus]MCR8564282.1 hypothetical protein [Ohessyouella blattaphilus]
MDITSDIRLKGKAWEQAISELSDIFVTRTNYSLFMLSLAIGIMYDKRIPSLDEDGDENRSVPRNVINTHDNGKLDFFFQAAILSTTTEDKKEDERLELAFGDEKTEFNKVNFLLQFANYGVTKLVELIGDTPLETMEKIKNFLVTSIEGNNFEIDELMLEEMEISEDDL